MKDSKEFNPKIIISGGGTGGHIFPAISIANSIKNRWKNAEILFVGAENRMEMEKVPSAGYKIIGLPVVGFDRNHLLNNISVLKKLWKSLRIANKVVSEFKPNIAIGVGGYASGPTLKTASKKGIQTLIQEQNSYPGVTNKMLASKASKICVAYEGMEKYFPASKIVLTGNPCRQDLILSEENKKLGYDFFQLDPNKKTILVIGGSLGARTLNESIINSLDKINKSNVQIIWQCGKYYYNNMQKLYYDGKIPQNVHLYDFVSRMDYAYSVADLIISRAGAGSISEFCILKKPVILVPSPNVAEDHQTKNAMALVDKNAAILVKDNEAVNSLFSQALELIDNEEKLKELSANIEKMSLPNASEKIVDEIEKLLFKNKNEL